MPGCLLLVVFAVVAVVDLCSAQVFEASFRDEPPVARGQSRVAGRVVTVGDGQPVPGARVSLSTLYPGSSSRTVADSNGVFEFDQIAAGTYQVTASKAGFIERMVVSNVAARQTVTVAARQSAEDVVIRLRRGGVVAGQVVDEFGEPLAGVGVVARRMRYETDGVRRALQEALPDTTDDLGQFRLFGLPVGDYQVMAIPASAERYGLYINTTNRVEALPAYYPGAMNEADAQIVAVGAGGDTSVQIVLRSVRPMTITGTAMTSRGAPAAGFSIRLRQSSPGQISTRSAGTVSPSGAFTITGIAPGDYAVDIGPPQGSVGTERGSSTVRVRLGEPAVVAVVTTPGATVSGTIEFEGSKPGTVQVEARAVSSTESERAKSFSDIVGDDGAFVIRNLPDRIWLVPGNPNFSTRLIVVDGRELVDEPLELGGRTSLSGVRLVATDRQTELRGGVTDDRNRALANHSVVLMRLDAHPDMVGTEVVRLLITNAEGEFQVRGLAPGSYVAGVVELLEENAQFAPEFQHALRQHGRRFSLRLGEPLALELGMTTGL